LTINEHIIQISSLEDDATHISRIGEAILAKINPDFKGILIANLVFQHRNGYAVDPSCKTCASQTLAKKQHHNWAPATQEEFDWRNYALQYELMYHHELSTDFITTSFCRIKNFSSAKI